MMTGGERILVYAMQSSGASLFALILAQIPSSIAVVDLWNDRIAPSLTSEHPIILKAVVTDIPIAVHQASFRPTKTILFVRNPTAIAASLATKPYCNEGGSLAFKLAGLDEAFAHRQDFDATVTFESLLQHRSATLARLHRSGITLPSQAYALARSPQAIARDNCEQSFWCRRHYSDGWGFGAARYDAPRVLRLPAPNHTDEAKRLADFHAPRLTAHYRARSRPTTPG